MRGRIAALAIAILSASSSTVLAQGFLQREVPHAGSIEVDGSLLWTGGYSAGTAQAIETPNPSARNSPLTLFQSSGRLENAFGVDARAGVYLTGNWSIEGGVQIAKPKLTARVTNDFESAPDTTIEETVTQYLFDGSVLYHFTTPANGRVVPFVSGGGGYLRELDTGGAAVQTGNEIHGGGGLKYWLNAGARRVGLRVEARVSARTGSVDLEATRKRRVVPTVSGGLAFLF